MLEVVPLQTPTAQALPGFFLPLQAETHGSTFGLAKVESARRLRPRLRTFLLHLLFYSFDCRLSEQMRLPSQLSGQAALKRGRSSNRQKVCCR